MLGCADGVASRRVHHHDAKPRGRLFVDVVRAHTGPHDCLEAVIACENIRGDLHTAATDGSVVPGERLAKVIPLQPRGDFMTDSPRPGFFQ